MIIFIVLAVIVLLWVITTYNALMGLRQRVEEAFSTMDVYLKKRFDLIPNLVETVKGYAKHESETLENVIKARNSYMSATTPQDAIDNSNMVTQALSKLFSLTESYPELKANENFLLLQQDLKAGEEDIANSRKFYNACVRKYNGKVMMIPSNIVASLTGFKASPLYEAAANERENVKVKF